MAKDQTEVGITGKAVPKPRTAKQQYELEKKRRMQKHLGTNVGGKQYTSGAKYYVPSTGGTNPRARTFREFVEIAEAHKLAHKFPLSADERETAKRIGKMAYSGSKPQTQSTEPKRSARKIKKFDLSSIVKEEEQINEMPYQIYGPGPHGSSDAEPQPLGKPYKNKKRAKTRADKLDQEIGGYRHFVRKVDEENELDEAKVPVTRQAGDFRYPGRTGEEKAERRAKVLSNSPDPRKRRQANTIRNKIKTVADRDTAQASSEARQKLYRGQQTRANQLAHELIKARKGEG